MAEGRLHNEWHLQATGEMGARGTCGDREPEETWGGREAWGTTNSYKLTIRYYLKIDLHHKFIFDGKAEKTSLI